MQTCFFTPELFTTVTGTVTACLDGFEVSSCEHLIDSCHVLAINHILRYVPFSVSKLYLLVFMAKWEIRVDCTWLEGKYRFRIDRINTRCY